MTRADRWLDFIEVLLFVMWAVGGLVGGAVLITIGVVMGDGLGAVLAGMGGLLTNATILGLSEFY